jgi:hypothetical protein
MKTYPFSLRPVAGAIAGALLLLSAAHAAETAKPAKETDAFPVFDNYITFGGTATDLSGAKPAFQARTQTAKQGAAGIEEMSYNYELSKQTNLQVDGKALPGAENYLLQFRLTKNEVGSFEAGYKQFRTFYDGAGGFFPLNNAWLPLYQRALYVDRSKFFVNATIALPKRPVFTFRYNSERRDGRKDSTIWGDTDRTGVPIMSLSTLNLISANRKIVPAYLDLNERQETWEASVRHTIGKTTGVFTLAGNRIDNVDTRTIDRYPGELKPFPAIPSNPVIVVPPSLANNQNKGFDRQGFRENGLTVGGRVETAVTEKITVFTSGNYRHANEDVAGSRLINGSLATAVGPVSPVGAFTSGGRPPYSYNSVGQMKTNSWVGNVGVQTKLIKDLRVDVAVKAEEYKTSGATIATYVNNLVVPATGAVTESLVTAPNSYKISERPWTPQVDVRYTGIKNVAVFALWDYRTSPSDERTTYTSVGPSGTLIVPSTLLTTDKIKEKHSNLKVGANWTVSPKVTLRGEFFTKDHENNFNGYGTSLGSYYTLDYDIYGARLTATVKPLPTVSFNTRYVAQRGKGTVMEDGFITGDSNDTRRYEIAETIDWNPNKVVYVQANVNLVYDRTSTAYPRAGGTANDVLHNADNNYWNGSIITGFIVDKNTDAQFQTTYYKANNYNPALAVATDPYGQGVRDYSITFGIKRKFTSRLIGSAKLGYLNSNSETTGGFSNYKGAVGYASVTYRL